MTTLKTWHCITLLIAGFDSVLSLTAILLGMAVLAMSVSYKLVKAKRSIEPEEDQLLVQQLQNLWVLGFVAVAVVISMVKMVVDVKFFQAMSSKSNDLDLAKRRTNTLLNVLIVITKFVFFTGTVSLLEVNEKPIFVWTWLVVYHFMSLLVVWTFLEKLEAAMGEDSNDDSETENA